MTRRKNLKTKRTPRRGPRQRGIHSSCRPLGPPSFRVILSLLSQRRLYHRFTLYLLPALAFCSVFFLLGFLLSVVVLPSFILLIDPALTFRKSPMWTPYSVRPVIALSLTSVV